MAKWEGRFVLRSSADVTVEADDWSGARQALYAKAEDALQRFKQAAEELGLEVHAVDVKRQLGEPWVSGGQFYMDHQGTPSKVLVFERAHGNVFTREDTDLILERCGQLGKLKPVHSWNGEGCPTFSVQFEGREGYEKITEEQRAMLLAPRPE